MATLTGNSIASTYTGLLSVSGAGDDFIVDGTTLVVAGDTNRVGIGTASPSVELDIKGSSGVSTSQLRLTDPTDATSTYLGQFSDSTWLLNNTTYNGGWTVDDADVGVTKLELSTGHIVLATAAAGVSVPAERMRIDSAGDVTVSTGNLVIGTSGKGIDFSATSDAGGMTNELLDDYEEGTWTGSLTSTTPPTAIPTAVGTYVKIGRQVTVNINLNNKDTSGGSGQMYITGLPFAVAAYHIGSYASHSLEAQGSFGSAFAVSSIIEFMETNDASGWGSVQMVAGTGKYLYATVTYQV
jgi:hypothetical protein